jgi:hypothetical protein
VEQPVAAGPVEQEQHQHRQQEQQERLTQVVVAAAQELVERQATRLLVAMAVQVL